MAKWNLVSKHEYEFISALPRYVKTLIGLVVGLGMSAGGVALLVYGTGGPNSLSAYIFGVLLVLIGLPLAGVMVLTWPWKRVRWVRVYEEGLRWRSGRREHKYRWRDVTDVSRTEMDVVGPDGRRTDWTRTAYLVLSFADGSRVSFDPAVKEYTRLANYVQQAVAASQLSEAAIELDNGGKNFGLVHLAKDGVTAHGRFFPWNDLKWLTVNNGELCAHHRCEEWQPIPLEGVSNYVLLLALAKSIGRLRE